uniref:Uncharacterized protein n=1 Tax=Octopus bimaculoides TaxID=37653 RepID=A0A0L8GEM0_OCTBM
MRYISIFSGCSGVIKHCKHNWLVSHLGKTGDKTKAEQKNSCFLQSHEYYYYYYYYYCYYHYYY